MHAITVVNIFFENVHCRFEMSNHSFGGNYHRLRTIAVDYFLAWTMAIIKDRYVCKVSLYSVILADMLAFKLIEISVEQVFHCAHLKLSVAEKKIGFQIKSFITLTILRQSV